MKNEKLEKQASSEIASKSMNKSEIAETTPSNDPRGYIGLPLCVAGMLLGMILAPFIVGFMYALNEWKEIYDRW